MPTERHLLDELVESAPDAMVVVDDAGSILFANRQTETLFGYSRDELLGSDIDLLVPEGVRAAHVRTGTTYAREPVLRPMGFGQALHARRRDGTEFAADISLAPLHLEQGPAVAVVVRDVTSRIALQRQLEQLALHDPLTGLANRSLVMEQLGRSLARRGHAGRTAVAFIDVDRLKWVNDTLGHEAGDQLIVTIADRLRLALRPADTIGRFGGDEFVAVVDDVDGPADVVALAQRVLTAIRRPLLLGDRELLPTVSIGLALAGEAAEPEPLIRDADAAMYRAKRKGRDRFEIYGPEDSEQVRTDLDLHGALARAVRDGTIAVHYQPIVDLRRGGLWGAEALVRWSTPQHGTIDAQRLVSLAERSTLILDLDRHVLHTACRDLAALPEELVPRIGVNISARHLSVGDLPELVRGALAASGLAPHRLWVELTESERLTHLAVRAALDEVQDLGVLLAIDDFGTGFSSLSRLRDLPVRLLKVDRAFTSTLATDFRSEALVAAVIGLGHALGQDVVVEGVETPETLEILRHLGCDLGQGYLWAAALPVAELATWREPYRASTGT